jgi:hypothetical protein
VIEEEMSVLNHKTTPKTTMRGKPGKKQIFVSAAQDRQKIEKYT